MVLRAFFANILANLHLAQLANQPRPKYQREEHGGETRVNSANRDVAKYVERTEIFLQDVVKKVVEHLVAHLLRVLEFRRMDGEQTLHDALHLHATRTFHHQQVSRSDKAREKLRGLFGR